MIKKLVVFAALALSQCGGQLPAYAQWQTPNHSVPIGKGAGIIGFGSFGPCAVGVPFIGAGASADPTCSALNLGGAGITGALANSNLANMPAWTLKGNNTSGSAAPQDFTVDALTAKTVPAPADEVIIWDAAGAAMKKATLPSLGNASTAPTVQRFTSGTGLTYTRSAGVVRARIRISAGGGGGGAAVTNPGGNGTDTSFGTWTAIHGNGGAPNGGASGAGGTGGVDGTGTLVTRIAGSAGASGYFGTGVGGQGGMNLLGGAGGGVNGTGGSAPANSGGGGAGGGNVGATNTGAGGAAGEYVEFWMTAAQLGATQTYTVGVGGSGGAAGTQAGGNGAAGQIIIEEFYN